MLKGEAALLARCRRRLAVAAVMAMLLTLFSALGAAAATAVVTAARTTADGERARLEITLTRPAPYRVFTLPDPPRVVVDLDGVRVAVADAAMPKGEGTIAGVRLGRVKPGTARLVVDLTGPARIAGSRLIAAGNGHTLTVDLAGRNAGRVRTQRLAADGPLPGRTIGSIAGAAGAGFPTAATPFAAASAPAAAARAARPAPRDIHARQPVVVIDPGHGGVDPGAISRRGLYEKHVTLAVAREIRDQLTAIGPYRVILTRNRDVFIPLRQRVAIARRAGADLLLSIHADKMDNRAVRGLSVYTLSERASDAEAAALAERENKVDLLADVDLSGAARDVTNILIDLAQRDTMNQSARVAQILVAQARGDLAVLSKAHRFAGFAVLKAPDVPSVLVELGFLSNEEDEAILRSASGRRRLARSVARGVDGYFTSVEVANRR